MVFVNYAFKSKAVTFFHLLSSKSIQSQLWTLHTEVLNILRGLLDISKTGVYGICCRLLHDDYLTFCGHKRSLLNVVVGCKSFKKKKMLKANYSQEKIN